MVVPVIGSMAIRGVFKASGLLSGLGSTGTKLKEVQQRSKSTTTEMKRMTKGAHTLRNALAAIGVAGFSALLMTTPQLAGALAKIKTEMMLIAWSIGKHLKPALDDVATILRGIRTGDWSTVIRGIKDLTMSIVGLVAKASEFVINLVFGEGTFSKMEADFNNWIENLKIAWDGNDLAGLIKTSLWDTFNWIGTKIAEVQRRMSELATSPERGARHREFWSGLFGKIGEFQRGAIPERQVGGMIGQTGMYKMHAGETVTMAGSTPGGGIGGTTDITIDFSGTNINLAGGIQLDQFAEAISMKIAEKQQSLTY